MACHPHRACGAVRGVSPGKLVRSRKKCVTHKGSAEPRTACHPERVCVVAVTVLPVRRVRSRGDVASAIPCAVV
jgi:hypothetical protein